MKIMPWIDDSCVFVEDSRAYQGTLFSAPIYHVYLPAPWTPIRSTYRHCPSKASAKHKSDTCGRGGRLLRCLYHN